MPPVPKAKNSKSLKKKKIPKEAKGAQKSKILKGSFPSPEELLAFIKERAGNVSKREIARTFGITGDARIELKRQLRMMEQDGLIEREHKQLLIAGVLPNVVVANIIEQDNDGELIAIPADWHDEDNKEPPKILILPAPRRDKHIKSATFKPPAIGDRALLRVKKVEDDDSIPYTASIIKLIDRKPRGGLGIFRETEQGGRIIPIERKQREITIVSHNAANAQNGDLVRIEFERTHQHGPKRAKVTEIIAPADSEQAISSIALHVHGIPHIFPDLVLQQASNAQPVTLNARKKLGLHEDWRDKPLITIDPADAKDHDDAVMAEADPEHTGGFIVTVAIADVAYYIHPHTAMDEEAFKRGNSVYFPDRVIPMLPERISNDLCSLKEGEDRPALAVRMSFNSDGIKQKHSFHRILMHSHARLSYEEAQAAIDGHPTTRTTALLDPVLSPLWAAYACLLKGRNTRQPLDLELAERKVILKEDGHIDYIKTFERFDAHKLIEEFMIQANVAAAETLEAKKDPFIYRIHDQPALAKIESLQQFLRSIRLSLASKSGNLRPANFNAILAKVAGSDHEYLVNEMVLRSQSQAEYNPDNIGHFGLNLRRYAHFTSPIRRYADLTIHRALISTLSLDDEKDETRKNQTNNEQDIEAIASQISMTERRAMAAERETNDRLIATWLSERVGAIFKGRIAGVTKVGLFVKLNETGADGFIPAATLGQEFFRYNSDSHSLIGDESGETHQLGNQVTVKLVEALPFAGALRFELLSRGQKGKKPTRSSSHKSSHKKKPPHKSKKIGRNPPKSRRR